MRRVTASQWLRRHLQFEPRAASFSLIGGMLGPMMVAGLQVAMVAWADRLVFFTIFIGG